MASIIGIVCYYIIIACSKRFSGAYADNYFFFRQDIRSSVTNIVDKNGNVAKGFGYDAYGIRPLPAMMILQTARLMRAPSYSSNTGNNKIIKKKDSKGILLCL